MRIKAPSEAAEYGEQICFDVLTKRKLETHRTAVSDNAFFQ